MNLDTLAHAYVIINTPLWLDNLLLNLEILNKHEFIIKHTSEKLCRSYTKEEIFKLMGYLINMNVKQALESYKSSKIPPGFENYLTIFLVSYFEDNV